jgi:type IV pilus assembly protein PilV
MNSLQLREQEGSVILEALFGILIFSIGILGLVALQAASIKNSSEAQFRNEAGLHADELIGQMWTSDKNTLATNFSSGGSCNAGGKDYRPWCQKIIAAGTGLPGATAPTVKVDPGNVVTITITWFSTGSQVPHQYTTVTQIN